MDKFFKSKFFIILLVVAVVLTVIPSVMSLMGAGSYVKNAIGTVFSPFQAVGSYIASAADGFVSYFREFDSLVAENERLRAELSAAEEELYQARLATEESEWLRTYLGLLREHTDFELVDARIIGREAGNYVSMFTLNRGTSHGIDVNMPVITDAGIVGYVTEAGLNWCRVSTILDSETSVGAYVERSGELGVVEGRFSLRADGMCCMTYLETGADIKAGDRICSSGLGSVYPRGLLVGEVVSIGTDEGKLDLVAAIKPAVDFSELSRVMVVTAFFTSVQ